LKSSHSLFVIRHSTFVSRHSTFANRHSSFGNRHSSLVNSQFSIAMDLYNLGKVPWEQSQLIYHALADMGREALVLVSPATPYVCIGFHQDVEQEVDLAYCRAKQIPVFRRDVGGGAVYLDGDQLFFQLILHQDNSIVPATKEEFYRTFLLPVINVYRRLGIRAEYKPINDVIAGNRKISGSGVGEIGACIVFVGNLILDFDFEMMARVLKVPDEKFRDKVYKTLVDNLSTIRRELGEEAAARWGEAALDEMLAEEFARLVGPLQLRAPDQALLAKMDELGGHMLSEAWLTQKGKRNSQRDVKIRAGVHVAQKIHKARGGLIRTMLETQEGGFTAVSISGDFFCYPPDAIRRLESALAGTAVGDVASVLQMFYAERKIETPGIGPDDWLKVLTV
jgi:lipoate---protein ligase